MHTTRLFMRAGVIAGLVILGISAAAAQQPDQSQSQTQGSSQGSSQGSGQDQSQGQNGASQPTQPMAPIPAIRSPLASLANGGDVNATPQAVTPDTHPLAGAQYLTLGGPALTHSYWQPALDVSVVALSNPVIGGSGGGWTTYTSVSGELDVHRVSGYSDLSLLEEAGGAFSNTNGSNSFVEEMAFEDSLTFRRWTISLIDQLAYLPQAAYGYTSLGTVGGVSSISAVNGSSGLQTGFVPNQSILTAPGQRIANTGLVQANYLLTPRSSITLVGSDGILHYFDNDLNNTNEVDAQIGYNYQWTRKDTIAILYTFDSFRYDNINQSIDSHTAQFSYGRRVTGKLSFQLAAGPEIVLSTLPLTDQVSATNLLPGQTTQILWSANAALNYELRRTSFQATYAHGVTGGAGVLAGAVSDTAGGTLNRQLSRMTGVALSTGYSRNKGLSLTPATTSSTVLSQTYDYWFEGINLNHTIGRSINVALGYEFQYQNSNQSFCVVAPCGSNYTTNEVSFDLSFRPKLIPF